MVGLPAFDRYIGIDYSGAETPKSSLKGLRVYMADRNGPPTEVPPPPSPRKYWTRREIADWLVERLSEKQPALVGIDHGFSFPLRYFDEHHLLHDWPTFLDDFQRHWPTDDDFNYVQSVRDGALATVQLDAATPVGGESQKRGLGRNLYSTSTCRDRLQSPRMLASLGYGISAYVSPACTFGLSMAGTSRRDGRLWQKSIPRFGAGVSRGRIGMIISTTHFPFRNGCAAPTLTVRSRVSWLPLSYLQNSKQRTLRAGYWESSEPRNRADSDTKMEHMDGEKNISFV